MARVITFFPNLGVQAGTMYSEVFEATDVVRVYASLRSMTFAGTGSITAQLETTNDPCLVSDFWENYGSVMTVTTAPSKSSTATTGPPMRFLRAKLVVGAGITGTIAVDAVARASS